jgi:hypothetical protein
VSRKPKRINPTDKIISANLVDAEKVLNAVQDSEVAYLTAGLPYNIKRPH